MVKYLECFEDLQFQHGPIEQLSNTDTWNSVHSSPITVSNSLDLLIIAIKNTLQVYKCSQYASALITKSTDDAKGIRDINSSKVTTLSLENSILAILICEAESLLAYQLENGNGGVLELENMSKTAISLPKLNAICWSKSRLLCHHQDTNKLVIYNFENYAEKGNLPEKIICKSPDFTSTTFISGLDSPNSESFWVVGHASPPFFITVTLDGTVSGKISPFEQLDDPKSNRKLAGICALSPTNILLALLTNTEMALDSTLSLYDLDKGTLRADKKFSVDNELFIQDETFGETLTDPFGSTVKFLTFIPLGIVIVTCSHASQAVIFGHGELWNNEWSVVGMDEGCSLEVSDSLNCPRAVAISTRFKETLHRRHAQADTPPLVDPPLVILAQRDCTIALHYVVTSLIPAQPATAKPSAFSSDNLISALSVTENIFSLDYDKKLSRDTNLSHDRGESSEGAKTGPAGGRELSPLIERFFQEGVKSGDGLPIYQREARDALIETLSQAFTLIDQSLDGLDQLSAKGIEIPSFSGVEVSVNGLPTLRKDDFDLSHVQTLIAEFVCAITKQLYYPPLRLRMGIIDLEAKVRSRVKWLRNPSTKCNDFLFHHFVDEVTETTLAYTSYLLEPGFFATKPSPTRLPPQNTPIADSAELADIRNENINGFDDTMPGAPNSRTIVRIVDPKSEPSPINLQSKHAVKNASLNNKPTARKNCATKNVTRKKLLSDELIEEILGESRRIRPNIICNFQYLFKQEGERIKLRHVVTDRIRQGYMETGGFNVKTKKNSKVKLKTWSKTPHISLPLDNKNTSNEWSAVKERAERASKAAQARLAAEQEKIAQREELEKKEREKAEAERLKREKEKKEKGELAKIESEKAKIESAKAKLEREKKAIAEREEEKLKREKERIEQDKKAKAELELLERLGAEREKIERGITIVEVKPAEHNKSTLIDQSGKDQAANFSVSGSSSEKHKEQQHANGGTAFEMLEPSISKPENKTPQAEPAMPSVKADFSAMLSQPTDSPIGVFRRQTYGFGESSFNKMPTSADANEKQSDNANIAQLECGQASFGGFSSFATGSTSLAELAQKASGSLSGFGSFGTFGGGFGSFGDAVNGSNGNSATSAPLPPFKGFTDTGFGQGGFKGFTDTGFGQGGFKGFTSSPGGFGEGGFKGFSNDLQNNQQNQTGAATPPKGDLWNKPRRADPLN